MRQRWADTRADAGPWDAAAVSRALRADGDSRLALDPETGLNKYLCPPEPAPGLLCASSCTASPITPAGFAAAAETYGTIMVAGSAQARAAALPGFSQDIERRLLRHYDAAHLAEVRLFASGTDAVLATARFFARQRPGSRVTAILPCAAETGSGVPLAAAGRAFDGPGGTAPPVVTTVIEIALRDADGAPLAGDVVDAAYARAVRDVDGHAIVYLTHGTKTGLIAPVTVPEGCDVVVDACQARIEPVQVTRYLRRGWPVILTGSKFFGGPAFSGAVLFPRDTCPQIEPAERDPVGLGTVLRWTAALVSLDAVARARPELTARVDAIGREIARALSAIPRVVPKGGMPHHGEGWSERPTIFTFAVRDPADHARLLTIAELRPLYGRLAGAGVLLGQPVGLGAAGGLRVAIGARDLTEARPDHWPELFATLADGLA